MKKELTLHLKKEWYDMIESGEKREEYREMKDYWLKRLTYCASVCCNWTSPRCYDGTCKAQSHSHINTSYTHVRFVYGYTRRSMSFKVDQISIGYGRPEWGAPTDKKVFIIKLGYKL